MSFLFGGRPQLSSEQKIAAAEAEIDMVSDMYSRYGRPGSKCHNEPVSIQRDCVSSMEQYLANEPRTVSSSPAPQNASTHRIAKPI